MNIITQYLDTPVKKTVAIITVGTVALIVSYRLRLAWFAKKFEGIKEIKGNMGFTDETLSKMITEVGFKPGEAWCAYFVKAVYKKIYPNNKNIEKILSASTYVTWDNAKNDKTGTFSVHEKDSNPKKGDIVIWEMWSGGNRIGGHTGIVIKGRHKNKQGIDVFSTIEGNTSYTGNPAEGEGVLEKEHQFTWDEPSWKLKGFIRRNPLNIQF